MGAFLAKDLNLVKGLVPTTLFVWYHQIQEQKLENARQVAKSMENSNKILIGIMLTASVVGALYIYSRRDVKNQEFQKQYENLQCPITLTLMVEPTTLHCGHSFEKSVIQKYFDEKSKQCPLCKQIHSGPLRETIALKYSIEMLRKKGYKRGRQFLQSMV